MTQLINFLAVTAVLTGIILLLTYFINSSAIGDYSKRASYECGFEPFGDARNFFDIHFYIVGLLFIIFDLEVVFLVPLVAGAGLMTLTAFLSFIFFMLVLIIGFYFE
jgi:NADH-quinone oxidoreductase subunit A